MEKSSNHKNDLVLLYLRHSFQPVHPQTYTQAITDSVKTSTTVGFAPPPAYKEPIIQAISPPTTFTEKIPILPSWECELITGVEFHYDEEEVILLLQSETDL
eukprot:7878173-Ditylum_brightwellii.AAC.1